MERHPTDFFALLFGLLFVAVGGGYIVHEVSGRSVQPVWVTAIACVTVGAAFLAVTLVQRQRRPDDDLEPQSGPEPPM